MTQSIACSRTLVDGNKRRALGGLIAFLGMNGRRLTLSNDDAYDLIIAIPTDELDEVAATAEGVRVATEERSRRDFAAG